MNSNKPRWLKSLVFIAVNLILAGVIAFMLVTYVSDSQTRLYNQNVGEISSINKSASVLASSLLTDKTKGLGDILRYIKLTGMDYQHSVEYISKSNADTERSFQLVSEDYSGVVCSEEEDGSYPQIDYSNYTYKKLRSNIDGNDGLEDGEISFMPEFTDNNTAIKSVAIYSHITLKTSEGKNRRYTLMSITKSSDFVNFFNNEKDYDKLSTILCYKNGNYITSGNDFKSDNFYKYIYTYNNLTLDQSNQIVTEVDGNESGTLYYLNSKGEKCVYAYTKMDNSDWVCVTCVPEDSFHNQNNSDTTFILLITSIMLALLAFDMIWQLSLNSKLKKSIYHERIANGAKTDFLSRMSHDIRTPLNGIIGMSILAADETDNRLKDEYISNIHSSGKFLLGLVNDILDMSKIESGKLELKPVPYSYSELKKQVNAIILPLCKSKNIEFEMTQSVEIPVIVTDPLRLNQVIFNLLSNAVKYTDNGGKIQLICSAHKAEGNNAQIDIAVKDNGCGMSEEFQNIMFEAFSQENHTDRPVQEGTGLGLAIVKKIVTLLGGTISVVSKVGEGTSFYISFHNEYSSVKDTGEERMYDNSIFNGKNILLCEDHPLNAIIATRLIEKKGMKCYHAENGKIGVEMFEKSEAGFYDVVLMDIKMPLMNGLEAAAAIRSLNRSDAKTVPIIAMTANAYDEDVKQSHDAGMNEHLAKPIEPELMYSTIAKYLIGK